MSRILVIGVGAIGGYVAAVLSAHGADVSVLLRGAALAAVRRDGLRIQGGPDSCVTHPTVLDVVPDAPLYDLVLLSTKAYDSREAVATVVPALKPEASVVALQNGLGRGAAISSIAGRDIGLDGVVYLEARMEQPGVVSFLSGARRFEIGDPTRPVTERAAPVASVLSRFGLDARAHADPHSRAWRKLVLVATANSMTGATRQRFGRLMADDLGRTVAMNLLHEGVAVARAAGADFAANFADECMDFLIDIGPELRSSMLHDIERGKQTEVDALNGEIVRQGERLGVPTPSHAVMLLTIGGVARQDATDSL